MKLNSLKFALASIILAGLGTSATQSCEPTSQQIIVRKPRTPTIEHNDLHHDDLHGEIEITAEANTMLDRIYPERSGTSAAILARVSHILALKREPISLESQPAGFEPVAVITKGFVAIDGFGGIVITRDELLLVTRCAIADIESSVPPAPRYFRAPMPGGLRKIMVDYSFSEMPPFSADEVHQTFIEMFPKGFKAGDEIAIRTPRGNIVFAIQHDGFSYVIDNHSSDTDSIWAISARERDLMKTLHDTRH